MAEHVHLPAAAAQPKGQDWGQLLWLAGKAQGNAQGLTLGRVTIKAGMNNPRHRHNRCEEVLYLMAGELVHTVGDASVRLKAGDTLTIPRGAFHGATSVGREDADMIVAYDSADRDFELEKP
ncbi:MAG: cupin domain-containing protein [Planctomycetota bacterium]|nr:cupin domain-containing protein [Planctomycetota bacterium]